MDGENGLEPDGRVAAAVSGEEEADVRAAPAAGRVPGEGFS